MVEPAVKLRNRHRNWRIWQSGEGRWWAADEHVTWPLLDGCVATLDADDISQLEALLDYQQEQRASVSPQITPDSVIRATGRGPDQEGP